MSVNDDTLRAVAAYRAATSRIIDAHTRGLVEAWVNAWDDVADQLEAAVHDILAGGTPTRAQIARSARLAAALDAIGEQLQNLVTLSGVRMIGDLPTALQVAGVGNTAMIASQLPPWAQAVFVTRWDQVQGRAVAEIIRRTSEQITARSIPLTPEAMTSIRSNLVRGLIAGENPRTVARRILADTEGLFNGGMPRALRIARTEMLDAQRAASALSDAANAEVLAGRWQWVTALDVRTCQVCIAMHGQQFPQDVAGPLGHPNCVLPGAVVSGPAPSASTTRWFDGEVIDIETADGRVLAVTPNHPILTPQGWIAAGALREGDEVVTGTGTDRPTTLGRPDDYQRPALIEDVAKSLGGALPVTAVSVPTSAEDFHGDGAGSDVHVVRTNGLLGDHMEAALRQHRSQLQLVVRNVGLQGFSRQRGLAKALVGASAAAHGRVSGLDVGPVLFGRPGCHHQLVRAGRVATGLASVVEDSLDEPAGHAEGLRQSQDGFARRVPLDYPIPLAEDLAIFAGAVSNSRVLRLSRRTYSGHVYNLQTGTGWYLANGILTHNCRCTRVPVLRSWADLGFVGLDEPDDLLPDADAWFGSLPEDFQRRILGPQRFVAWQNGHYPMSDWAVLRDNPGWRQSWAPTPAPRSTPGVAA